MTAALYWELATGVSFVALLHVRTKVLTPRQNVIGSAILALATGWALWPIYGLAAVVDVLNQGRRP